MTSATLAAAALLAGVPTLHSGERQWFVPGQLRAGAHVICKAGGHSITLDVPRATSNASNSMDLGGRGIQASITTRPNGAVEIDCNTTEAPERADLPFVATKNGLGLIRGTNTLARVRKLYGAGSLVRRGGGCRVTWPAIGLAATFAPCTGSLLRATVTGRRWSSLNGVHIGDPVARMLWQDQGAFRVTAGTWALGGHGRMQAPRLLARVSTLGVVTSLVVVER